MSAWDDFSDEDEIPATWEDEEAGGDDEDVPDEWDVSDEEGEEGEKAKGPSAGAGKQEGSVKTYAKPKKKKTLKQLAKEKEEKERKMREMEKQAREEAEADPGAARKNAQRAVEEADIELSKDLFSGFVDTSPVPVDGADFTFGEPTTESEFVELGSKVGKKLQDYEGSKHFQKLLKELLKEACNEMRSDEVKDVQASLNVLYNNKIKEEKGPKKKRTKKKKANVRVAASAMDDYGEDDFNAGGDFDGFM